MQDLRIANDMRVEDAARGLEMVRENIDSLETADENINSDLNDLDLNELSFL